MAGTNFSSLESVQRHLAESAQYLGAVHVNRCARTIDHYSFESPLEAIFSIWWIAMERAGEISDSVTWKAQAPVTAAGNNYRLDFQLLPEYQLQCRAELVGIAVPRIAVELDGHDFHERTKEQVARRNQRDRDLAADGWLVLHFSGSEIYRDPTRCIHDVFEHAYKAFGWGFELAINEAEYQAAERAAANQVGATTSQES
jgi:hypothetical protein